MPSLAFRIKEEQGAMEDQLPQLSAPAEEDGPMQRSVVISGFGGQGALFAGQILAHAAMDTGHCVTWFPSYGVEMRGGVAHCTVIVSDREIGSPIVGHPDVAIALNNPSTERFQGQLNQGGLLVVNSSMVSIPVTRNEIDVIKVPGGDLAIEVGDVRMTNMVLLGAMLAVKPLVQFQAVEHSLRIHLPPDKRHLIEPNVRALHRGSQAVEPGQI